MSQLTNNAEVLAHLSTFLPRSLGFSIESTHSDEQSTKIVLSCKDDAELVLYISVVQLSEDFYSVTYTSKRKKTALSSSFDFGFDQSSLTIKLPTTQEEVDSTYDGPQADWLSATFVGYSLKRLGVVPTKILPQELDVIGRKNLVPVAQGKTGSTDEDVTALMDRFKSALSEILIIPGAGPFLFQQLLKKINTDDEKNTNVPTHKNTSMKESSSSSKTPVDLPKFDDEYEVHKRPHVDPSSQGGVPTVGGDDIYGPAGKFPDTRPGLTGPIGGFNGMIVDKNHPLFGQGGAGRFDPPSGFGAPPGARGDDPFGPIDDNVGMGLPYGSSRGGNSGRGGFGSMGGPFGGGPPGFGGFM